MNPYLASVITGVVGAAVAILTNYWRTRYTARAQDFSKRLEDVAVLILKLETFACEYWGSSASVSPDIVEHILGFQEKLSIMLGFLDNAYSNFKEEKVLNEVTEFSKACTGGTFGSKRQPEPDRIRHILIAGENLKIALLLTRSKLY